MKPTRWLGLCAVLGCSGAPQTQSETAVTYRAVFTAEPGINTTVTFPAPNDNSVSTVEQGMTVDGGTFNPQHDTEGDGIALIGQGTVSAQYQALHLTGLGEGTGFPVVGLTRGVLDGGANDYYFRVNKAGLALVNVQFEYTAQRNCGGGCGGKRSWTYTGSVGLGLQDIALNYAEEKQP